MAKFNFAFEKVLMHRKSLEDIAKKNLGEVQAFLQQQQQILEEMESKKRQAFENRHQREVQGGHQSAALIQAHDYLKGQDLRIMAQKKKVQECEKQVEDFRELLRIAAVDSKIIESLREKKKEEFLKDQKKLEQKRLDDMVTTRFRR